MNILNTRTQIPEGVRDQLPREAACMRRLSVQLGDVFRSWGYREVVTPGLEYLDTVVAGAGSMGRREDLYQLFDRKGRTLALRADMTTPIARIAASKMAGEPLPLRLSYFAPVYRHRAGRAGNATEIWQAGTELIGASGPVADAEVVAMACSALAATGLTGARVGLGHVDFVEGIFQDAGVAPAREAELKEALGARDLVAFEKGVREAGLEAGKAELLIGMATFQGSYEQALERFRGSGNQRVARALTELGTILALLADFGVAGQVSLDLGLTRSLDYYTGVVFEGYAPGVGSPVLGGGRYDNLLADFGGDQPATGFALEMDRLLAALERQGRLPEEPGLDFVVECPKGREAQAMARARELRGRGLRVAVDLLGRTGDELAAYARSLGGARVVTLEREGAAGTGGEVDFLEVRRRLRAAGFNPIH
ncbi:MAG TPA: ATP phosphoribosyltransferase regulatory subunit [Symbiobacteriaceae bacterium]|nr:ATP phosphoribosyltransferase regulatory subunit [Symbiobacteriaceae bacterium]